MKTVIVIPARYASSRLPGKPLLRATGKYLVEHVYERACQARADVVVVATDDPRIVAAGESFGGRVVLTRRDHASGTDRVADVAHGLHADVSLVRQAALGVDTRADYERFVRLYRQDRKQQAA